MRAVQITRFGGPEVLDVVDLPDPTPDNHVETRFESVDGGTLMTMRMTLPDAETRAAMLATGMESGMEVSYARLEGMLEPLQSRAIR